MCERDNEKERETKQYRDRDLLFPGQQQGKQIQLKISDTSVRIGEVVLESLC